MDKNEFKKWLNTSTPGMSIVYHVGSLMFDRQFSKEVDKVAEAVWRAAGMLWRINARLTAKKGHTDQWQPTGERRIVLTQRRLSDPFGYEYIATKL